MLHEGRIRFQQAHSLNDGTNKKRCSVYYHLCLIYYLRSRRSRSSL
jgi:hypothetical protein